MSDQVVVCPNCKTEIPLSDAISHQIREELRKEFESSSREKEQAMKERSVLLDQKERDLKLLQESIDSRVSEKLVAERAGLEEAARRKAEIDSASRVEDLLAEIREKDQKLEDGKQTELTLRSEKRALEERGREIDLEVARKVDEESDLIRRKVSEESEEKHRLKDRENEQTFAGLRATIAELQKRADQGSQQLQGEALEIDLEEMLKARFPLDKIEPVPKGMSGADVIQKVYTSTGLYSGTIVWESKRTKSWSDGWIDKLKDDQREIGAELAVILSTALPDEVKHFGFYSGVWVTDYSCAFGAALALRSGLIEVATTKLAAVGKNEKTEMLYTYLTGPQFRQRVEALIETFIAMKSDLDHEKRAVNKIWAKRSKQIDRVVANMSGLSGELQSIAGSAFPQIPLLELEALASTDVEGQDEEEAILELPL